MKNKSIVITGATGLIGRNLALTLLEQGAHLILPVRNVKKAQSMFADGADITYIEYDFSTAKPLEIEEDVDYIVHAACPTTSRFMVEHAVETMDTIVNGTRSVLELARQKKSKSIVYLSSMEVYGEIKEDKDPITEDVQGYVDPLNIRSSYPIGKRMAEALCYAYSQEYDIPVVIARLAQTFGPGVDANTDNRVFAQFARSAKNNQDISLLTTGGSKRMYLHTHDAVSAIMCLMQNGEKGEAYNIANDATYCSIREMAEFVKKNFNPSINININTSQQNFFPSETLLRLSTEKIRALGWSPQYELYDMYKSLI